MTALVAGTAMSERTYRHAVLALTVATFFSAWISWRPFEQLFTLSDALYCIGAGLMLHAGRLSARPFEELSGPWHLCLFAMLSGLLASSIANGDPGRWLIVALQYSFAIMLLPMILMPHSRTVLERFALALVLGIVVMQAFGAFVYFFIDFDYLTLRERFGHEFITGSRRLGAFLGDANWNAAMVAMALPFLVFLMDRRLVAPLPGGLFFAILVLGLMLSASVTGLSSASLAMLILVLASGSMRRRLAVAALGIAAVTYLVLGGPLPAAFSRRIAPALASGEISEAGTFESRWELMREAWEMTDRTMALGIGVDQFRVVSAQGAPVHNMFLLIWTEGGALALFGWLGLLFILLGLAVTAFRHDRMVGGLALAIPAVFIVQATAAPHMYARMWMVPVLIAAALAVSVVPRRANH